jgi:hypothetical protein
MTEREGGGVPPALRPQDDPSWVDATIPMVAANRIAFAMFPFVTLVVLGPYALLWGADAIWADLETAFRPLPLFVAIFFGAIVVHEALHGVGFALFGRVPRREISFGIKWKTFTPYTHTAAPMSARAYRGAVALPGLALGIVPALVGLALGNGFLAAWGTLLLGAAGGDIAILWAIRAIPAPALVRDHPAKAGCLVRAA